MDWLGWKVHVWVYMIQKQQTAPDETAYSLLQLHLKKKVIFNPPYVLTIYIAHYNIFSAEKASFSVHKSCPTCSVVVFMLKYPHGGLLDSIWYHMRWCGVTTFDLWPLNPRFGGHFGSITLLILFDFPLKKNVLRSENCHMIPNDHMNACGEGYRYLASMYNTKTTVLTLLGASLAHFIRILGWLDPLFWPEYAPKRT